MNKIRIPYRFFLTKLGSLTKFKFHDPYFFPGFLLILSLIRGLTKPQISQPHFFFGRPVIFILRGKWYKCEYQIGSIAKLVSFTKFIFRLPNLFKQMYFLSFYRGTGTQLRMSNKRSHETTKILNPISFWEVHLFSFNVVNYQNANIENFPLQN